MLENGNLISLILNKSSHLEGMALTQQQGSTRHRRVEFIFEVSGIYRGNLEAIFSCFFFFFSFLSSLQRFISRVDVKGAFAFFLCVPVYLHHCKAH